MGFGFMSMARMAPLPFLVSDTGICSQDLNALTVWPWTFIKSWGFLLCVPGCFFGDRK